MAPRDDKTIADLPREVTEPRILTPTLIVLLGSTPALAALETMRLMLSLNEADRNRVAFVFIDTDDVPPKLVEFRQQYNGMFLEFPLRIAVPAGISAATRIPQPHDMTSSRTQNAFAFSGQGMADMPQFQQGGLPSGFGSPLRGEQHTFVRQHVPQYFANGAGGIRNNGHVAFCFRYADVKTTLDQAIAAITQIGLQQGAVAPSEIQVNIVAFMGGGTGSGILPDVAVSLRQMLLKVPNLTAQRINLWCMLPESIRGVDATDVKWRKSNATATLLEVLGLSLAAWSSDPEVQQRGIYDKYIRQEVLPITRDPIANEVYLIGHSGVGEAGGTARIVGLDLFQRTLDASGLGFLEHSKWVDRRTLGERDDRQLPTILGTSCPMEVFFAAQEAARAFAQVSAARMLPLLASVDLSKPVTVSDNDKQTWIKEWRDVARPNANPSEPYAVAPIEQFGRDVFVGISRGQIDLKWVTLEKWRKEYDDRVKAKIEEKKQKELEAINTLPRSASNGKGLMEQRIQHMLRLRAEYRLALDDLQDHPARVVPARPRDAEAQVVRGPQFPLTMIEQVKNRIEDGYATELCDSYNDILKRHAISTRHNVLTKTLAELLQIVEERLDAIRNWAQNAEAKQAADELEELGLTSNAWKGQLDQPHPHQRHVFDLATLSTPSGANLAMERLYRWATKDTDTITDDGTEPTYERFVSDCLAYLNGQSASSGMASLDDPMEVNPARLAARVVDYFYDYYLEKFADKNLFQLFEAAAPPARGGESRARQISNYLKEHLEHVRGLMRSLVAFETELSPNNGLTLNTSVYLGMHWRNGQEKEILDQALHDLGALTRRNNTATTSSAIDPHHLQICYGQHAFSMSMVREFYKRFDSAMANYLEYQGTWNVTEGTPVHASGEMERLVWFNNVLPFSDAQGNTYNVPLYERVIRE